MLNNLKELRKDDIVNNKYIIKNNKQLHCYDQTIINGVCSPKIGLLIFNISK